jgi:hypothetical protein
MFLRKSLADVKEICENTSFEEVNKMLGQGWFLLDTYHGKDGFTYVLGKRGGN